jgi:N-acetylglucosamine-6-phosphate deacetylase
LAYISAKAMQRTKIYNAKIITPARIISGGSVVIDGDKIIAVHENDVEIPGAASINAGGQYLAPGFIDIHVHGGGGYDFMDGNADAFLAIAETHARYGTTSMLPTTLSSEKDELYKTLTAYSEAHQKNKNGARFLGMHIEGPYFAMNQRGAQDPRYIRDPDPSEYEEILSRCNIIRRWSAAPERKGALQFAKRLREKNILPALAHTDAVYDEVIEGFKAGYTLATHLYSGMSGVTRRNAYRYAGAVESAFLIDDMDVEIIADGRHLPAPLLKLVYKIKGADRTALITDAMRAAGTPVTESILGSRHDGLKVIIEDGVAKLPDRASFAGSVATTDRLVRTMIREAEVSLTDAIKMMTQTPARILELEKDLGSIEKGKKADLVIFDDNINIAMTIIGGRIVHEAILQKQ